MTSVAFGQRDTVEFKLTPKYYPENDVTFKDIPPPEIAHSPTTRFPEDPKLRERDADVWVNLLVNRKGRVTDAKVVKSSDDAFNKHALFYALQYRFKWTRQWPETLKHEKGVWLTLPIRFRHR
jgi:TonB family protein